MTVRRVFLNGRWLAPERAKVSVFDRGFLYGEGLIETIRVTGGAVPHLRRHLARLAAAAGALGIDPGSLLAGAALTPVAEQPAELPGEASSLTPLARLITEGCRAEGLSEGVVRLAVTPGPAPGWQPNEGATTVVVALKEGAPYGAGEYRRGLHGAVVVRVRRDEANLAARYKLSSYITSRWAAAEAAALGADEGLLLNTHGRVAEGGRTNLFVWDGSAWRTPPVSEGALPGIARGLVLTACWHWQLPVVEAPITRADLARAPEAFFTNALMGMMPGASLDGRQLASVRQDSMVGRLHRRFMPFFLAGGAALESGAGELGAEEEEAQPV